MDIALEQPARARLITGEERELVVSAKLRYASTDPLAVHIDFPGEVSLDGHGATWTFARSLLEEGLREPAGDGDVHIWPCGQERTVVELHSPYGMALLQFDACALNRFLLRTYAVVATGEEDLGAVVERGLSSLFGSV
ncbi:MULTISPECIES: SsgA family sporulation/cell division regulator [unclassified Streptomyces]|uniref:SsgA family sporulation/cell division regulator n=1 Tax=unclassified Streptomyces TaxID=2593676 RepID=UPI0023662E28|nr:MULTISPECIES: SsgA family sporulation/cell division regulator [unclassified Streptomyces]MDF3141735.1 SsgA family sporulation/cell division regulator [Streptomyces sp. T21Q-yed]WDF44175.1 SsgA family sporulation/cell division regulator [Streptomyces sp. T12]